MVFVLRHILIISHQVPLATMQTIGHLFFSFSSHNPKYDWMGLHDVLIGHSHTTGSDQVNVPGTSQTKAIVLRYLVCIP